MRVPLVAAVLVIGVGCGRVGFDPFANNGSGSAGDAAPPVDAAACAQSAVRLPIDTAGMGTWVTAFTATKITSGFAISYVAPDAQGFALTFDTTGAIATLASDTQTVGSETGQQIGGDGNTVLVMSALAGSTWKVSPYSRTLAPMGAGQTASNRTPIARGFAASGDGSAVALFDQASGIVDGRQIKADGTDAGPPTLVLPVTSEAMLVEAHPAATGYLLTWVDPTAAAGASAMLIAPDAHTQEVGATVIRANAALAGGAFVAMTGAYARQQGRYLFAWEEQHGADAQVFAQLADASLGLVGAPQLVGHGDRPRVGSDGNSFWIAWMATGSVVAGAHVTAGGEATPWTATGTGNAAIDYDFVNLDTGLELLWFESVDPDPLWAVPACTLVAQ